MSREYKRVSAVSTYAWINNLTGLLAKYADQLNRPEIFVQTKYAPRTV